MESQLPQFREYPYRIIIVLLFSLASVINGMCWVVVTPISVPIQNAYNVSPALVAFIPMSYMLLFIFVNFPSNWVLDVKGIKKGMVIGAALTFLGCMVRCLVKVDFVFVVVGQVFCALGQPFIINAPMKIATRWFMPENRSLAMAILTVSNIIGTGIGFVIPSIIVEEPNIAQTIKEQFFILLLVEAIIAAVTILLVMVLFKQSPRIPASMGSMAQQVEFKKSIGILFRDRKFMALALSFGTVNGTFNIYGSLMDDLLHPYGFSPDQVSIFGVGLMATGIVAAGIFGVYVQRTLKYRNAFWLCSLIGILTTVAFPLALKYLADGPNYTWAYLLMVCMQGFVFIPLQPLTIDYASDIMFPIGQAQITGLMLSMGQIFGIAFVQAAQLIFKLGSPGTQEQRQRYSFNSVIFCNVFLVIGCLVLLFQNGELKRANFQQGKTNEKQSLLGEGVVSIVTSRTNQE